MTPRIWTARVGVKLHQEFELIPAITRSEVEAGALRWQAYAPPRWLIDYAFGKSKFIPEGFPVPPPRKDPIAYRNWSRSVYLSLIPTDHAELLSHATMLFTCWCANPSACHRSFLAEHLMRYGAVYEGEL